MDSHDRSVHLDALLGELDDEDYDNIALTDDVQSIADSLRNPKKKPRKLAQLPDKYGIISQRGTELMFAGQYQQALDVFEDVATFVKNFAPMYMWMADCCQALGQNERAFDYCKKATQIERGNAETWAKFVDLAEILGLEDNMMIGLKAAIVLNMKEPEVIIPHLHRLVELLEARKTPSTVRFQRLLFQAEMDAGCKPDCYTSAAKIARSMLQLDRAQAAFHFLDSPITIAIDAGDLLPEDTVLAYTESLLRTDRFDRAFETLVRCNVMTLIGPDGEECPVTSDNISVATDDQLSLPLVAAVCIVLAQCNHFEPIRELFCTRIMATPEFPDNKLFLDLAILLRQKGYLEEARQLLERLQQQPIFQSPEFYFQLGTALESLKDLDGASHAFNRALSLKPTLRAARYRLRRLGLPVPKSGTPEDRERTIVLQKKIFAEYSDAKVAGDDEQMMNLSLELISSSFGQISFEDVKEILFPVASPYRIDIATKEYVQYAPAIAVAGGIELEDFWNVVVQGCRIALEKERYEDLLIIAFHGICTSDLNQSKDKMEFLREAVLDAAFHLGHLEFCLQYLRDGLLVVNRPYSKGSYSTAMWNFFYQIISQRKQRASHALYKWASRCAQTQSSDPTFHYTDELHMIMANDSIQRENYRNAFDLYNGIITRSGIDSVPWFVILHLGILYVNLACRHHCSQRIPLYSAGMQLLDKYGARRGICPEVHFNKGRAAQQFGDLSAAIGHYEECIRLSALTSVCSDNGDICDYAFKSAYNLRAIFISYEQPEKLENLGRSSSLNWKAFKRRLN